MSKIEGLIFDMDGTLLDSETFAYGIWKRTLREFGCELSHEFFVSMVGTSSARSKEMLLEKFGQDIPFDQIRERKVFLELETLKTEKIDLRPGAEELLEYLNKNNIPFGLATSSERIRAVARLKSAGVLGAFKIFLCGDEVEFSKPNPEIYLKVACALNIDISRTIVIEDSSSGVRGGLNAGARVCWFKDLADIDPDLLKDVTVINSLKEVIPILASLRST